MRISIIAASNLRFISSDVHWCNMRLYHWSCQCERRMLWQITKTPGFNVRTIFAAQKIRPIRIRIWVVADEIKRRICIGWFERWFRTTECTEFGRISTISQWFAAHFTSCCITIWYQIFYDFVFVDDAVENIREFGQPKPSFVTTTYEQLRKKNRDAYADSAEFKYDRVANESGGDNMRRILRSEPKKPAETEKNNKYGDH